ncbi:cytochrome P450 [Mycolicibacterium rhodesiae JS60]|nr:cytochrome P450 [Mycolicibacterium rhodesiae JS60]
MAGLRPEEAEYNPLSAEARADPERQWGALRRTQAVHHYVLPEHEITNMSSNVFAAEPTTEFWTVLRLEQVEEVLGKPQMFLSCQGPGIDRMAPDPNGGVLIFADGKQHRRHRQIAAKAFAPRAVEQLLPQIQRSVDDLIDAQAPRGRMELMQAIGVPLAMDTILKIMGLPAAMAGDFHRWGGAITNGLGGEQEAIESGGRALAEMFAYLEPLIDAIRSGASNDERLDTGVLAALVRTEHEGAQLTDYEVCQIAMQIVVAGYETTSTALLNGVHALCTHPAQRELFISADSEGVALAIEEILRFVGPQAGLFRTALADTEIGGCLIPKDGKVRVAFASANRDETLYQDASEFRIDRSPAEVRRHVAFGRGPHVCIGAALARAELRIALTTLFRRLPDLELHPEGRAVRNDSRLTITGFQALDVRWNPELVQDRSDRGGEERP